MARLRPSSALISLTVLVCLFVMATDKKHFRLIGQIKGNKRASLKHRLTAFNDNEGGDRVYSSHFTVLPILFTVPVLICLGAVVNQDNSPVDANSFSPTKAGGALDYERLKLEFVRGRDYPPPPQGKAKCRHCQLSSRCYRQASIKDCNTNINY